jgi:hypothetical protein
MGNDENVIEDHGEVEVVEDQAPPPAPSGGKEDVHGEHAPVPDDTPLSAEEVDLESQRKDETSALAGDQYDSEGNRVIE